MEKILRTWCLTGSCLLIAAGAFAQTTQTPTYTNAQVISVDSQRRVVVLRTSAGARETLTLDDILAGTGNIKAGDNVMVTLRGAPGVRRISAISLMTSTSRPAPVPTVAPQPSLAPGRSAGERAEARKRYTDQVAALSQQAQSVDATWNNFVTACAVKPVSNEGGGRDWFGLWDGRVSADYSGGACRDLFNQIVTAGEGIKKAMAAAESGIEEFMTPGEVRDIRRSHSMNWDGWLLGAPARKEP